MILFFWLILFLSSNKHTMYVTKGNTSLQKFDRSILRNRLKQDAGSLFVNVDSVVDKVLQFIYCVQK